MATTVSAAVMGLLVPALGSASPSSSPPHPGSCVHMTAGGIYDLTPFRNVMLSGVDSGSRGRGGRFNVSICGDLLPCRDELTGQPQPAGMVYELSSGEPPGTCWDIVGRWDGFVGAKPLVDVDDAEHGAVEQAHGGVALAFSRPGDAHIECDNVTVGVTIACDPTAPEAPERAGMTGRQIGCHWQMDVRTSHRSVCGVRAYIRRPQPETRHRHLQAVPQNTSGGSWALVVDDNTSSVDEEDGTMSEFIEELQDLPPQVKEFVMEEDNLPIVVAGSLAGIIILWLFCVLCIKFCCRRTAMGGSGGGFGADSSAAAGDDEELAKNSMLGGVSRHSTSDEQSHLPLGSKHIRDDAVPQGSI